MERLGEDRGFAPDLAVPPGETLKETIDALGMSQAELALRMNRPLKTINEIIKAKAAITPQTAIELERVLRTPAQFWLRLEMDYQTALVRQREREEMAGELRLLGGFPYSSMAKLGWVARVTDDAARVAQLRSFFGVVRLSRIELVEEAAWRKSKNKKASPEALSAWLRKGELDAQGIETSAFDRELLRNALNEIRGLTHLPIADASPRLKKRCASCGIAVVYVPHLPGTYVNGATRWLTSEKGLIQLSIRYRYEDIFWFTFFHECGHLLKHRKRARFIDMDGDVRSSEEVEADEFASDMLIPPQPYRQFCKSSRFSVEQVKQFALDVGISPAIVVGRLQHDKLLPPTHLNHIRRKLKWTHETV